MKLTEHWIPKLVPNKSRGGCTVARTKHPTNLSPCLFPSAVVEALNILKDSSSEIVPDNASTKSNFISQAGRLAG